MRLAFCERSDTKCLVKLIPTKEGSDKVCKVECEILDVWVIGVVSSLRSSQ